MAPTVKGEPWKRVTKRAVLEKRTHRRHPPGPPSAHPRAELHPAVTRPRGCEREKAIALSPAGTFRRSLWAAAQPKRGKAKTAGRQTAPNEGSTGREAPFGACPDALSD